MIKVVATNKKAYHDYFIEETYEAGIELLGSEVKSVRQGKINIRDSFAIVKGGEVFLINMHISPYEGSILIPKPKDREGSYCKEENKQTAGRVEQKGYTLVPTKVYFKQALVKVEIGVARGKELYDKGVP